MPVASATLAATLCALLPLTTAEVARAGRQAGPGRAGAHPAAGVVDLAAATNDARERPDGGSAGLGAGGGIDRVVLRFEGSLPASLTALAEADLRTAFGRRGVEVVRRDAASGASGSAAGGVFLTIASASERLEQIALKIEEKSAAPREAAPGTGTGEKPAPIAASSSGIAPRDETARIAFALARRLDLNALPSDGRMLALVVAADEMLVAAGTEHQRRLRGTSRGGAEPAVPGAVEAEATTPAAPAAAPDRAAAPSPPRETAEKPPVTPEAPPATAAVAQMRVPAGASDAPLFWRTDELAATFAFDHFGGGQTQLGLDLAWRRRLGARWIASLAAQARQGLAVTTSTGTIDSRLLGGRVALGRTLAETGGRLWLTGDLGARAGRLQYEGRGTGPDGRPIGHQVGTFFGYVDATLALDVRLGRSPLALRLGAGVGLPLLAQEAASGDTVVTGASGAAFESQAGLVLTF